MYSHAQILAFLYAGALTPDQETDKFDDHEGHRGFVANCEPLARRIADQLNAPAFADVFHDGVVEYEVIEPLGAWVLNNPTQLDQAFDRFCDDYRNWLIKSDVGLTADQLADKYNPKGDGEHGVYPRALWRAEVAAEVTLLGYWEWAHHRIND